MRRSKTGAATQASQESRGNFTPPSRGTATSDLPAGGNGSRLALRNWRVRTRLYAILLIPVIVGLVFGGFRVQDSVGTWSEADEAQRTAELVRAAATYGNALIDERDRTAEPLLAGRRNDPAVERVRTVTDRAKQDFDRAVAAMPAKPGLKRRLATFRKEEPKLGELRKAAYTDRMGGVRTEEGYVTIQHPLMEFANELGFGTGNITSYGRTVYSISLGKAAQSLERSIAMHILVSPGPSKEDRKRQFTALTSYAYLERIAMEEYVGGGRPEDIALLKREKAEAEAEGRKLAAAEKAKVQAAGEQYVAPPPAEEAIPAIVSGAGARALKAKGITPKSWFATSTGKFDAYRAVEKQLADQAVEETEQISSDARQDALVNALIVLVSLLLAFVVAGMMARSMSRSMRNLRNAAFGVAEQRLPSLVDQLSRTDPGRVDTRVAPIPIDSRDEIGEVARAFDQVHREAVRLAAEQALLRGNVNAIFTNLSSRNQGLIERQLGLISDLENNEADPDQLESLFRLDHLATRMRRNGENLLVLAGEEPGRRWNEPVPLVDILRAASSEVEHYERIELSGIPESEIHGQVVNDLVHLLAELLENATTFSSPQSKVHVTATRLPDGRVVIEIHDKGIGLTAEDFADINHKLADPPTVDASLAKRMGLFVVGRLADRHGIRVQLRPSGEQAGTTCLVMLPEAITRGGGGEEDAFEDFTVSRIMPEQPGPPQQQYGQLAGARSAAELGFDDGSYRIPDDVSSLDPAGRPLPGDDRRDAPREQPGRHRAVGPGQGREERQDEHAAPDRRPPLPSAPPWYEQQPYGRPEFGREPPPGRRPAYEPYEQPEPGPEPGRPGEAPSRGGQYAPPEAQAESAPGVHGNGRNGVGFDRPGPAPSDFRSTTGAGLPRRESARQVQEGGPEAQHQEYQRQTESSGSWHSANDERWSRAGRLREPQSGGTTSSGLPRRVPKANLVEGTAEAPTQGGPAVSRAPEDVRGRLSNLHRGVRRGRNAGDGPQNDRQGYGPGSTYDQER
ncbi:nitrate- and nitrite sensing domain-containing protein [Streptomyces ovatisporus]|uniref:histidine kinase n=1 Tax=Streptomyces ovatisporus TaxID=1128682 RepID=A0ABV9A8R3_9ACTN